jgi:hypothetical protein
MVATVGTVFGAVYKPVAEIEPQALIVVAVAVHVRPQVTAVFEVPITVALN